MTQATVDKVVNEIEWPYDFRIIMTEELVVDPKYQRPLTAFYKKIVAEFDPALVVALVVSDRGDSYAVIDGQTRRKVFKELVIPSCPCLVYSDLTVAQEAEMFVKFQKERKNIGPFDRFRASLVAKDSKAVDIKSILDQYGYEFSRGGLTKEHPNKLITAITSIERAYKNNVLDEVLQVTSQAWHPLSMSNRLNNVVIGGLSYWIRQNEDKELPHLADALSEHKIEDLVERAAAIQKGKSLGAGGGHSVTVAMSEVIDTVYGK